MFKPRALTSLTFFYPCYNEAENVSTMIEQSLQVAQEYGVDHEVLIVDDGSTDGTAQAVERWAAKDPHVKLIRHPRNLGYGAALRTGYAAASKELVFMSDGDNQFRIADIDKLFAKIDSCDVVCGYRLKRRDPFYRVIYGKLWSGLNRMLFGIPVRDIDCAFKLFRRKCLKDLTLESDQVFIHAETLARLKKMGFKIQEIGVDHYPRTAGKPKAIRPGRVLKTFRELFRLYWRIR